MPEPSELIQTAAQPDTEPAAAQVQAPQVQSVEQEAGELEQLGRQLIGLLADHPKLAEDVAEAIGRYFGGGDSVDQVGGVVAQQPTYPGGEPTPVQAGAGYQPQPAGAESVQASGLGDLLRRIETLEQGHANVMLDKELDEARREYERLSQQLPVLPEFDEKAVMQISLDNPGISLTQAARMWVLDKALEGEGTLADRLIAKKMEASKGAKLPRAEGPGGSVAAGYEGPPKDRKEAMARAREMARAFFGGIG